MTYKEWMTRAKAAEGSAKKALERLGIDRSAVFQSAKRNNGHVEHRFIYMLRGIEANKNNLDKIMITEEARDNWLKVINSKKAMELVKGLKASEIDNEDCRFNQDGSITIFVAIKEKELEMDVPAGHWSFIQ